MKKVFCALLALACTAAAFTGCQSSLQAENKAAQTSKKTINEILAESQAKAATAAPDIDYPELDYTADVDLTVLSSNLVYSTVYNMMTTPADYTGKTVKASGVFDVYTDPKTGRYYFACIIADAAACCSQGLEFVLEGEHEFPGDYPEIGSLITVGGEFETYKEGEGTFCRLKNAGLSVK